MQGVGDAGDLAGRPRPRETRAPGEISQEEPDAGLQRMVPVEQHPRNLAQQTRHGLWSDQRGGDTAGVAERTRFSRGTAVDQHHFESEGLQATRASRTDDARADDHDASTVRRLSHGVFRRPLSRSGHASNRSPGPNRRCGIFRLSGAVATLPSTDGPILGRARTECRFATGRAPIPEVPTPANSARVRCRAGETTCGISPARRHGPLGALPSAAGGRCFPGTPTRCGRRDRK